MPTFAHIEIPKGALKGQRRIALDSQLLDPDEPRARVHPTFSVARCGQAHHPVVLVDDESLRCALPGSIDGTPLDDPDLDGEARIPNARAGERLGIHLYWRARYRRILLGISHLTQLNTS